MPNLVSLGRIEGGLGAVPVQWDTERAIGREESTHIWEEESMVDLAEGGRYVTGLFRLK
jgi:hypothetical protein